MTFLKSLLAFAAVLAIIVGAIWALVTFVGLQASLVWAALIAAIAWLVRSEVEKKRELGKLLAEQKRQQYLKFLDFMVRSFSKPEDGVKVAAPAEYREWSMRLNLIGSDEVVRAWNAVRTLGDGGISDETADDAEKRNRLARMMRSWGALLLEMRKDSGHPDTKLTRSEVFATFINDMETYRALVDS